MKLKEIHRTSTFAWSPYSGLPLLASGTVSGALDASFSNDSQLEIWGPDFLDKHSYDIGVEGLQGPKGVLTTSSRFNRLVWGNVTSARPQGVIAAGMENGELSLWDAAKVIGNAEASDALISRNTNHTGPVRALDFNNFQTHLLSSGAVNGEIYIWDLNDTSKPYSPGARSAKLEDVTSVAWNCQVAPILASSSNSGFTAVWDLRGKREVVALAYGGGAATAGGPAGGAFAAGGRRGMSDVAWHPDNATRLVTSSEDDTSPIIMSWDLRNARAPEKILTGHDKGVLSLSWCRQDADLLLSCGKDNRTLCWNPQTAELIGDLQSANNWSFQVQWCPRNPNLLATASFDGRIGVHSLQSTNEAEIASENRTPQPEGADIFDQGNFGLQAQQQPALSLKQPPKWLRRPVSATFGFGGQLASVSNQPGAQGAPQQVGSVHIRKFATEPSIVERAKKLQEAAEGGKLNDFAEQKGQDAQGECALEGWKALTSLFRANTRDELVTLLGFSKESIAANAQEAIKKVKASAAASSQIATPSAPSTNVIPPEHEEDVTESKPYEPVVSFAEPEREPEPLSEPTEGPPADADITISGSGPIEATPSEVSASATSDVTKAQEVESTATEPSLFGDDVNIGTPQGDANADFFATMGTVRSALPGHVLVPHHSYAADSSVAATIGSRPSSAASDTLKTTTFKIYPNEESEVDRLLTKSLVLGDFESAVSLCLSVERYADAILLAVKGGPELLQKTQAAYFTKQTTSLPYLRLYQSIVSNDLDDIVQNADLREWQEIFVILCTFAREDEFSGLAKQLGQRLEFQGKVVKAADPQNSQLLAKDYRRNATLCYLAAGKLEQVVHIWIEEMKEEETATVASGDEQHGVSRYTSHALALQTFVEKVAVFRGATKYVDADLQQQDKGGEAPPAGVRSYKLATLYDRYFEYADLLAAQGMLSEAVKYLGMTPAEYKGSQGGVELDFQHARERVMRATGAAAAPAASTSQATTQQPTQQRPTVTTYPATQNLYGVPPATNTYNPPAPQQQQPPVKPSPYGPVYSPANGSNAPATHPAPPANDPYAPVGAPQTQPQQQTYRPSQPYGNTGYGGGYGGSGYGQHGMVPPPGPPAPPPPRAPPKRTDEGWNDAPVIDSAARRTPSTKPPSVQAISSPFPNAQPGGSSPSSPYATSSQGLPPPPRSGMSPSQMHPPHQGQLPPPPPRGGSAMGMGRPPQPGQPLPPPPGRGPGGPPHFGRPASTGPGGPPPASYPGRSLSPLSRSGGGYGQHDRGMSPLAQGGPPVRQTQSHFAGPPPSQQQPGMHPPPPPGPPRGPPGPYAQPGPLPPQQQPPPPGPYGAPRGPPGPPPPGQVYAPGPGGPRGPPPLAGGQVPPLGPPQPGVQPPPPPGGSQPPPPKPAAPGPKAPKYPPGDRSHIPDNAKASYAILNDALNRLRQTTPPQQKRLVDDTERRLNHLFDALNCEALPSSLVDQLNTLTQAMAARDQQTALATHVDMLTKATGTEDIALWMSGVKQLILRA